MFEEQVFKYVNWNGKELEVLKETKATYYPSVGSYVEIDGSTHKVSNVDTVNDVNGKTVYIRVRLNGS